MVLTKLFCLFIFACHKHMLRLLMQGKVNYTIIEEFNLISSLNHESVKKYE
jgi:hypothetical protein